MLRNSTVLCFLWVHFSFFLSFLAGKRKKKPPSDFLLLLPCVSFTPSLLLLFLLWSRSCRDFAFSSAAASSSFYFWGDSAVAIRTNGTHTTTTGTQFMWDFSHLLFLLLLSLISHWRNPISILIWTPWDSSFSRKKKFGLEQKPQSLERRKKEKLDHRWCGGIVIFDRN